MGHYVNGRHFFRRHKSNSKIVLTSLQTAAVILAIFLTYPIALSNLLMEFVALNLIHTQHACRACKLQEWLPCQFPVQNPPPPSFINEVIALLIHYRKCMQLCVCRKVISNTRNMLTKKIEALRTFSSEKVHYTSYSLLCNCALSNKLIGGGGERPISK